MDKYQLYHGDCCDILPTLEAGSVDAVITDPPYGTTACKWDSVIPFAAMWAGIKHVVKSRAAVVLFGSQPFTSALVMSNPKWFRVEWIWEKAMGTNYLNANRDPMKIHENVIVFCDGYPTYNPQKTKGKPYRATRGAAGDFIRDKTVGGYLTKNDGLRYPTTIQKFNKDNDLIHPTQKPVALLEYIIKTYTNPGDIVLDFAMGSGTTGVAAMRTGRRFIGIEMGADYYRIAEQRIKNAAGEFALFDKEKDAGMMSLFE